MNTDYGYLKKIEDDLKILGIWMSVIHLIIVLNLIIKGC